MITISRLKLLTRNKLILVLVFIPSYLSSLSFVEIFSNSTNAKNKNFEFIRSFFFIFLDDIFYFLYKYKSGILWDKAMDDKLKSSKLKTPIF